PRQGSPQHLPPGPPVVSSGVVSGHRVGNWEPENFYTQNQVGLGEGRSILDTAAETDWVFVVAARRLFLFETISLAPFATEERLHRFPIAGIVVNSVIHPVDALHDVGLLRVFGRHGLPLQLAWSHLEERDLFHLRGASGRSNPTGCPSR